MMHPRIQCILTRMCGIIMRALLGSLKHRLVATFLSRLPIINFKDECDRTLLHHAAIEMALPLPIYCTILSR